MSVCDLNLCPFLIRYFLSIVEFSTIPLWTTETFSDEWGWALIVLGDPWVAHLTWPIPMFPSTFILDKFFYKASTLPSHLTSLIKPSLNVAMPAES